MQYCFILTEFKNNNLHMQDSLTTLNGKKTMWLVAQWAQNEIGFEVSCSSLALYCYKK